MKTILVELQQRPSLERAQKENMSISTKCKRNRRWPSYWML